MGTAERRHQLISLLKPENARSEIERLTTGFANREPLRTIGAAALGFNRNNDALWASALTYTTSLSLVPILALAFSALAGLGGTERLRPLIERYLAVDSPEIADALMGFIKNLSAKGLGEVGGAALLVTVIVTLGTVESAFNTIFRVSRGRTWLRKFSDYLSVIFTVPLLGVAAVAVRAYLMRVLPHVPGAAWGVSTLMLWICFTFLYQFFPNTYVKLVAAAMGGLIAAILLQIAQWGYVHFQVGMARYHAIYGAMAAVPILLTWIYLAWIIVLCGAELTAALHGIEPSLDIDERAPGLARIAALLTVFRAGERMVGRAGARPCTIEAVASELGIGQAALKPVVERLKRGQVVIEVPAASGGNAHDLYLARDSKTIAIAEVFACLSLGTALPVVDPRVAMVLDRLGLAEQELLETLTVNDLVEGRAAAPSPREAVHEP